VKTIALVQARLASTRLPGKVLLPLDGKCVLRHVLDRLGRARCLDCVVVATSDRATDDRLAAACSEWDAPVFRGSEADVLGRFVAAARAFDAARIVRVNADNPLIDPAFVDQLVEDAAEHGGDYVSYRRSDGRPVMLTAISFFAEVVTRECLERSDREIADPFDREHVTVGIYNRPEAFSVRWLDVPPSCNDARLRFTVDTPIDFQLLREIFAALGQRASAAGAAEIVQLVKGHPEWLSTMSSLNAANPKVNKSVERRLS
jgi:spore coat polysaccharide biosynthesis protein SpsF